MTSRINKAFIETTKEQRIAEMKYRIEEHMTKDKYLILMASFLPDGKIGLSTCVSAINQKELAIIFLDFLQELKKTKVTN